MVELVRSGDRLGATDVFEFVSANRAYFPVGMQCRVLGVSTSGYYAWGKREPSARQASDAVLLERIRASHRASRRAYGLPRIRRDLVDEGWRANFEAELEGEAQHPLA